MKKFLTSIAPPLVLASGASAGCYDWQEAGDDNTPLVKICYENSCDVVRQNFICSTVYEVIAGFDDGWHFTFRVADGQETRVVRWNGTVLAQQHAANITCEVLYGDAEGC